MAEKACKGVHIAAAAARSSPRFQRVAVGANARVARRAPASPQPIPLNLFFCSHPPALTINSQARPPPPTTPRCSQTLRLPDMPTPPRPVRPAAVASALNDRGSAAPSRRPFLSNQHTIASAPPAPLVAQRPGISNIQSCAPPDQPTSGSLLNSRSSRERYQRTHAPFAHRRASTSRPEQEQDTAA